MAFIAFFFLSQVFSLYYTFLRYFKFLVLMFAVVLKTNHRHNKRNSSQRCKLTRKTVTVRWALCTTCGRQICSSNSRKERRHVIKINNITIQLEEQRRKFLHRPTRPSKRPAITVPAAITWLKTATKAGHRNAWRPHLCPQVSSLLNSFLHTINFNY